MITVFSNHSDFGLDAVKCTDSVILIANLMLTLERLHSRRMRLLRITLKPQQTLIEPRPRADDATRKVLRLPRSIPMPSMRALSTSPSRGNLDLIMEAIPRFRAFNSICGPNVQPIAGEWNQRRPLQPLPNRRDTREFLTEFTSCKAFFVARFRQIRYT
jgi:hypothetical protein